MRLLSLMTTPKASVFSATFSENWALIWMSVTEFFSFHSVLLHQKQTLGTIPYNQPGLYLEKKSTLQHCKTSFGMTQHLHKPLKIFAEESSCHHNQSQDIFKSSTWQTYLWDYSDQKLMGCVAGFQLYLSETPRLSSEVSPELISPTIARWNFSFVELRLSHIESFGNRLGELVLTHLFCRVQVLLDHLEAHEAYTKKALTKQPFQQQLWKSRHYHPSSQEWVDAWSRKQLSHSQHRTQRCVSAELWMKMCFLGQTLEWYIHAGLQNHYSDYFHQLKRLCHYLYTKVHSNLCFSENHLEISTAQALLLPTQDETDFQIIAPKVGILCCWKDAS